MGELRGLNIPFIFQKTFVDCVSDKGRVLRFDFFLPEQNTLIEYDGEQHFSNKRSPQWKSFDRARNTTHDEIKTEYAKAKGIRLLRIPFTSFKQIPDIINLMICCAAQ